MVTEQVIVKLGYQQTEVGIIPEDWNVKTFKDVCWVNQGLQININLRHKNPSPKSKAYITIQYLNDGKEIEYIDDYKISVCCKKEDVLMTRTGNTGIIVSGVEGVFHNNFFKINYDKTILNREYLIYFLNQKIIQRIILTKAGTSTIPDLNHSDFYSVPIIFPKPKEQSNITKVLSDTDGLITQLDYLITKKKNIKQGAMQELLTGKRRLSGFSGKWTVRKLGDLGEPVIGLTYKPSDISSKGILVLRSSNVFEGRLRFDDNVYVDMDIPDKLRVRNGDILICVRNGSRHLIGKCAYIDENFNDVVFGAFMSIFRSPFNNFIFQQFQSKGIKIQIAENLGATINQITNKVLNSFEISFPEDSHERTAIAQILSDMDLEIKELKEIKDKYVMIKNGMMQKLLTGEIRVK